MGQNTFPKDPKPVTHNMTNRMNTKAIREAVELLIRRSLLPRIGKLIHHQNLLHSLRESNHGPSCVAVDLVYVGLCLTKSQGMPTNTHFVKHNLTTCLTRDSNESMPSAEATFALPLP